MKQLLIFIVLIFFTSQTFGRDLTEIERSHVLRVAVDGMSPPFNYYQNNKLTGFEIDLIEKIAAKMQLKIEWTILPFNSLLLALQQDRFDIIAASHTITDARKQIVDFIRPHYCNDAVIVSKINGPKTLAALNDKTVAVALGTVYLDYLQKHGNIKSIRTLPSEVDGLQALNAGRAEAWVTEKPIAIGALKELPNATQFQIGNTILQQINAMSVAKGNVALHNRINQELQILMNDGTYDTLRKKYDLEEDIRCR